ASSAPEFASGTQLRTYRLALAATGEYTAAVGGGTVAGALAAQVLIMNRVNGVYEREVAIRMVIVANNDQIVYTSASTDPYTNSDGDAMLDENKTNLNSVIGTANYDIGHVFSTGGGGIAILQGPCGSQKSGGVTGLPNPVGDAFAIDYVAHEMGHQWGAPHTFNGTSGSCSGNRSSSSAFEPGSGITIMAYAGICSGQNLAAHSIDTFHAKSLQDIINYSQTGNGNTCAVTSVTGNSPPAISLPFGQSFNIPMQTPFSLNAAATDPDGDAVSYDWQQYDLGPSTTAVPNTDSDGNARPIFRGYGPVSQSARNFPSVAYILGNENVPPSKTGNFLTGELLPSIARTMNFRVVVRDNRAGGGGVSSATASVIVSGTSGPFKITSPNTAATWNSGQSRTITWDVANTTAPPVSTANVRITLSLDGGQTFPVELASSTPNDGSQNVPVPQVSNTSQARVRIEAEDNIYFDISDANFSISSSPASSGSISGRVTNSAGLGLSKVVVVLTGPLGPSTAVTNGFGYYQFDDQPFSSNYTVKPLPRKRYVFTPVSISFTLASSLTGLNFTGSVN
ncbi:MAG: reprolysin-like metallopeptidase, partial [Acidobacteriota bacterium]